MAKGQTNNLLLCACMYASVCVSVCLCKNFANSTPMCILTMDRALSCIIFHHVSIQNIVYMCIINIVRRSRAIARSYISRIVYSKKKKKISAIYFCCHFLFVWCISFFLSWAPVNLVFIYLYCFICRSIKWDWEIVIVCRVYLFFV